MSDLASLIASAPEALRLDAAALTAWLNRPRVAKETKTAKAKKPTDRLQTEAGLRGLLDMLDVPRPIPPGTTQSQLARSYTPEQHQIVTRAMFVALMLREDFGLADADFTAKHFGEAEYDEVLETSTEVDSIAKESLGQPTTYEAVRAVLNPTPVPQEPNEP